MRFRLRSIFFLYGFPMFQFYLFIYLLKVCLSFIQLFFFLCQRSNGHICVGLFLGPLFCSDLCSSPPVLYCLGYYSIQQTLISQRVIIPSPLFFVFKIVWITLGPLPFYVSLRTSLPIYIKRFSRILTGNASHLQVSSGRIENFITLNLPIH